MSLIECLFEWAGEFAAIIGVFIVLLLVGAGVFFVGTYVLLVPGVLIEEFIHDEIIGNETRFENGDAVVRDQNGRIVGRSSETFRNTRDGDGKLVSRNKDDVGLLFRK